MEISQGTRFVVALMVAATPLGRFGSAGGHRFGGGIRGLLSAMKTAPELTNTPTGDEIKA